MILMVNCSLKNKAGNTQYFLELLKNKLGDAEIISIKSVLKEPLDEFAAKLQKADALVIGAPLYVDGLPSQAVKLLEMLLERYKGQITCPVYVVSNLGFYEAKQIQPLLDMVRNWCMRMGCTYGGGLAIGAGPLISTLKSMPLDKGLNKDIGKGLKLLSESIQNSTMMENYYTKTMIPRVVYLKAAHAMFNRTLKENGVFHK